jgi:hypothetical protein
MELLSASRFLVGRSLANVISTPLLRTYERNHPRAYYNCCTPTVFSFLCVCLYVRSWGFLVSPTYRNRARFLFYTPHRQCRVLIERFSHEPETLLRPKQTNISCALFFRRSSSCMLFVLYNGLNTPGVVI